jgi:hypothetical protein
MRAVFVTLAFGGAFLCGTASWAANHAATLEPVQGDLWINHGKGFEKVDSRIEAKVGDSVMVNPGGYAKLTYPDGCEVNVKPGAVTTIAPLSPCASGSLAADLTGPAMVTKAAPVEAAPVGLWPWVGLAAAAGLGVGIAEIPTTSPPQLYEPPPQ